MNQEGQLPSGSCKDYHCFNPYLLPQSIGSDNSIQNYQILITQPLKIVILQVEASSKDVRDQNGKPSTPPLVPEHITSTPY